MTDYAVMAKHPGFIDRFVAQAEPPEEIGYSIWWSIEDSEADILRFKRLEAAKKLIRAWELHFASKGKCGYSFVPMKIAMRPEWVEVDESEEL